MADPAWNSRFPSAAVEHVVTASSDHLALALKLTDPFLDKPRSKPFRYEKMWESHPGWKVFLENLWKENQGISSMGDLKTKLDKISGDLSIWDRKTFGNVRKEIRGLKQQLEVF